MGRSESDLLHFGEEVSGVEITFLRGRAELSVCYAIRPTFISCFASGKTGENDVAKDNSSSTSHAHQHITEHLDRLHPAHVPLGMSWMRKHERLANKRVGSKKT